MKDITNGRFIGVEFPEGVDTLLEMTPTKGGSAALALSHGDCVEIHEYLLGRWLWPFLLSLLNSCSPSYHADDWVLVAHMDLQHSKDVVESMRQVTPRKVLISFALSGIM